MDPQISFRGFPFRACELEAGVIEVAGKIHFYRSVGVAIEDFTQRRAGYLLAGFAKFPVREAALRLLVILCVQEPHHVIQRLRPGGMLADLEIHDQGNQFPFHVIGDRRVRRILVASVMFDPGVKTGGRRRIHQPAGSFAKLLDGPGKILQIPLGSDESGPPEYLVGIVLGETLGDPE